MPSKKKHRWDQRFGGAPGMVDTRIGKRTVLIYQVTKNTTDPQVAKYLSSKTGATVTQVVATSTTALNSSNLPITFGSVFTADRTAPDTRYNAVVDNRCEPLASHRFPSPTIKLPFTL